MALRKHIFGKPNYIYPEMSEINFEFDESDIHNLGDLQAQPKKLGPVSLLRRKPTKVGDENGLWKAPKTGSLPVNIPDWSKILKNGCKGHHVVYDNDEEDDQEITDGDTVEIGGKKIVPPHVYLARQRGPSFSVLEGIGRTLKGRDLRRMRDAIWEKLGFED